MDNTRKKQPLDDPQAMRADSQRAMQLAAVLNAGYHEPAEVRRLFFQLIDQPEDDTFCLFPPFYTDYGKNITIGKNVFINRCCQFQDQGGIEIGDGALIGHNVVLATLNHDEDPEKRHILHGAPIRLERNVWIGANATICQGVTIGEGSIIAAGAVVTHDIPPFSVAGGVPARVLREVRRDTKDDSSSKH